jgi:hypothetical protein
MPGAKQASKEELQKRIADLENQLNSLNPNTLFLHSEVRGTFRLLTFSIVALLFVQTLVVLLGRPSPFRGSFGFLFFWILALLILQLVLYFAMLLRQKIRLKAEIGLTKAKLEAMTK